MVQFEVNDITCGHCADVITAAIKEVASGAAVAIDMTERLVGLNGAPDPDAIEQAIRKASYTPSLES